MKKKTLCFILLAEFALLCVLQILLSDPEETVFSVASFPFAHIGILLGNLAATGSVGNGFALLLICAAGLTPILFAVLQFNKKEDRPAGIALVFTGILIVFLLPMLANDALLSDRLPLYDESLLVTVKTGICLTLWSCIVCFAVLRILRLFHSADKMQLFAYAQKILYALCVLFTAVIAVSLFENLLSAWQESTISADRLLGCIQFLANSINYVFDIIIAMTAIDLFGQMQTENTVRCATLLCRRCTFSLTCMVIFSTVCNVLHILLLPKVTDFAVSLSLPIFNIAFVLFIFLLARLIVENRKLHDDNDLFI